MLASFRYQDLGYVIDPHTEVHVGAFVARVGGMLNDGWQFEREFQTNDHMMERTVLIMAKNPRSGAVGKMYTTNQIGRQGEPVPMPPYLYFPPEIMIEMRMFREMHMPRFDLRPVEVGEPVPGQALRVSEQEMMIYEANNKEGNEPQELIVMPEDIPELMSKIQQAQNPRAKEMLANERKRNGMKELQMKAKILTFDRTG